MNQPVLPENVMIRAAELDVHTIIVRKRQRQVSPEHVNLLRESISQTGKQLVPIAVSERPDGRLVLIDGAHRLEAVKQEGRELIRAEVYSNLAEDQEGVLEFVTNKARKDLSPAEILVAWETFDLPLYEMRAKEKQTAAAYSTHGKRGNSADPMLIDGVNKHNSEPSVTVTQLALQTTGHAPQWLNKAAHVRNLAENDDAPAALQEAAKRGWMKLQDPNAKVEPVFKEIQKVENVVLAQAEDPKTLQARLAEDRLDEMVNFCTLQQEKLEGELRDFLKLAAGKDQSGLNMLRSVRVALVRSLTSIVVIECEISENAPDSLRTIGSEVTKMLSQESMKALNLRQEGSGANHV